MIKILLLSTVFLLQGCGGLSVVNDTIKAGGEASKKFNEGLALKIAAQAAEDLAQAAKVKAEASKEKIKNLHADDRAIEAAIALQPLKAQIPLINRAFNLRKDGIDAGVEMKKNTFWRGINLGMLFTLLLVTIIIIIKWLLEFFMKLKPTKVEYLKNVS